MTSLAKQKDLCTEPNDMDMMHDYLIMPLDNLCNVDWADERPRDEEYDRPSYELEERPSDDERPSDEMTSLAKQEDLCTEPYDMDMMHDYQITPLDNLCNVDWADERPSDEEYDRPSYELEEKPSDDERPSDEMTSLAKQEDLCTEPYDMDMMHDYQITPLDNLCNVDWADERPSDEDYDRPSYELEEKPSDDERPSDEMTSLAKQEDLCTEPYDMDMMHDYQITPLDNLCNVDWADKRPSDEEYDRPSYELEERPLMRITRGRVMKQSFS